MQSWEAGAVTAAVRYGIYFKGSADWSLVSILDKCENQYGKCGSVRTFSSLTARLSF